MRIALIYPATEFDKRFHAEALPIGLLYLAAVAERTLGAKVDIYDSRHGAAAPEASDLSRYDMIGFTAMSMQVSTALRLAQQARADGYRGPIAFGGPHASVAPDHLKAQPEVNSIFIGESEETFLGYLRHLAGQPNELGRVWLRESSGDWRFIAEGPFIEDLDRLPFPAREKYAAVIQRTRAINMTTTRGCPFQCNYCQPTKQLLFGKKVRRRSVGNIIAEIEDARVRFDIQTFSIDDDTFTFHKPTVLEFCERIKGSGLAWSCQSRSDIDREALTAMKESGLTMLFVGAESGSQRVLDLMNKHNTVEQNERFLLLCRELGVQTWCNMMTGYPGETEDDMRQSLEFVRRTQPTRVCVSQVTPFPGTRLWQEYHGDVIERDWDEMARHVCAPKFRSMARLQPAVNYYTTLMSKEWDQPLIADILQLRGWKAALCRRYPNLMHRLLRGKLAYLRELNEALRMAREGQMESGIARLEDLKRRYPRMTDPLGHLGWLYLATNRPAKALENYSRLRQMAPGNAEVCFLQSQALERLGRREEALEALKKALALNPNYPQAQEALQRFRADSE